MISLSTGILVTKGSKEADVGNILRRQLFSTPKVLNIVGIALIGLGLFTPLNMLVFCAYGIMFLLTARMIANQLEMTETDSGSSNVATKFPKGCAKGTNQLPIGSSTLSS